MTTPTPASSSPAPSTVIEEKPAGSLDLDHIEHLVAGHAALLEEIAQHAREHGLRAEQQRTEAEAARAAAG